MRILRGQSNSEVSSKGFALFVLGLIVATFIGGAVRTVLNSDSIQKRLLEEVQRRWPDVTIEIGQMRGQLSRGIWPGLAFHFENLRVTRRSCAGNSVRVDVEHLEAPLKLWSLWNGQAKLGDALAQGLRVSVFRQACLGSEDTRSESDPVPAAVKNDSVEEPALEELSEVAPDNPMKAEAVSPVRWEPLRAALDSLEVDHAEFTSEVEPSLKTVFRNLNVQIGSILTMTGEVELRKSVQGASLTHQMTFQVEADEKQADLNLRGKFKEGSLKWNVKVDLRDRKFHQEVVVHQLPTKDLLAELFHLGLLHDETIIKSFWLTCQASQDGVLSDWKAQPVRLSECRLDGVNGKIELKEAQINLNEKRLEQPAVLQVTQMQIAPVLEALRRDTMSRVFSRLGTWTGQIEFTSFEKWNLSGLLSNLEIIFSSQSVRGKQVVNSVRVELARERDEVKGRLGEFDLAEGQLEGEARLLLDSQVKTGRIFLDFQKISLSSGVQKILIGGQVEPLQLKGEGRLLDGDLEGLTVSASSSRVEGPGWKFANMVTQIIFKNSVASLRASAREVTVDGTWSHFSKVKTLYAPLEVRQFEWSDLSAQIEISARGGDIQTFVARDFARNIRVLGKGLWERDRDLTGSLSLISEKGKRLFSILGRQSQLSIEPL